MMIQVKKHVFINLLWCMCLLASCSGEKQSAVLELFPESQLLYQKKDFNICEDSLMLVEGIVCDGENLVVYDIHSGDSYTLFDEVSGKYISRFGHIGDGPTDIPNSSYAYSIARKCFYVYNDQIGMVMKYNLDSLRSGKKNASPVRIAKCDIPDANFSKLVAVEDGIFLGAGTYKSQYQYLLFDKNNEVMDYGIEVYNAADSAFNNIYTKYLANQGDLVMCPEQRKFAYSISFSSNIDFFKVENNKIKMVKSLRLGNPISKPIVEGGGEIYSVSPTEDTQWGYIGLSATDRYVYALYSEEKLYESARMSDVVLVFDWDGNPVKRYQLDMESYHIAVDEAQHSLFAVVKNEEGERTIICYAL